MADGGDDGGYTGRGEGLGKFWAIGKLGDWEIGEMGRWVRWGILMVTW